LGERTLHSGKNQPGRGTGQVSHHRWVRHPAQNWVRKDWDSGKCENRGGRQKRRQTATKKKARVEEKKGELKRKKGETVRGKRRQKINASEKRAIPCEICHMRKKCKAHKRVVVKKRGCKQKLSQLRERDVWYSLLR